MTRIKIFSVSPLCGKPATVAIKFTKCNVPPLPSFFQCFLSTCRTIIYENQVNTKHEWNSTYSTLQLGEILNVPPAQEDLSTFQRDNKTLIPKIDWIPAIPSLSPQIQAYIDIKFNVRVCVCVYVCTCVCVCVCVCMY